MPTDDQVESQSDRREIVVGVDGSEHSRLALKWASDEAKRHGSTLRILHAQLSDHENVPNWYEPGSSALSAGQAVDVESNQLKDGNRGDAIVSAVVPS